MDENEKKKRRPLLLFAGLALASAAGLGLVTRDQWQGSPPAMEVASKPETKPEQQASAEPVKPADAKPEQQATAEPSKPADSKPEQQAVAEPAKPVPEAEKPAEAKPADAPAPESKPEQQASAEPQQQPAAEPEKPAEAKPERQAAVQPEKTAEPAAKPQPGEEPQPAPAPEEPIVTVKPSFDTVRVEKTGEAIIAGTAAPGAKVTARLGGIEIGSATANADGSFVIIPDKPLPEGTGTLTLETQDANGKPILSNELVAVAVPKQSGGETMVAIVKPDEPTKVVQKPAAEEPKTEEPAKPADVATAKPEEKPAEPAPKAEEPPQPTAPVKAVSLDAVDYDDKGNIVFNGSGKPGSTSRIYVDNSPVGEAQIGPDGKWVFSGGSQIPAGKHTFRIDEIDPAGKVASRVELPFFREEPAKVAEAAPRTPAEEAPKPAEQQTAAADPAKTPDAPAATPKLEEPQPASPEVPKPAEPEKPAETQTAAAEPMAPIARQGRVVIQPGNNLWRLSRVIYGKGTQFTVIYEANRDLIRNPNLIYPGQIFRTPDKVPPEKIDPGARQPLPQ